MRLLTPLLTGEADERRRALGGQGSGPITVDIGLGDQPDTTIELFEAIGPRVIGIDADVSRVERAQPFARPGLEFRDTFDGGAHLIRAMNVLRGHTLEAAAAETSRWCSWLADGGLLVEGSTDADGALGCAHLWRKREGRVVDEGLLFFTDCSRGFAPMMFRDVLPRDLRRAVKPGTAIHEFLTGWQRAFELGREPGESPEASLARSVLKLQETGPRSSCTLEAWPRLNQLRVSLGAEPTPSSSSAGRSSSPTR